MEAYGLTPKDLKSQERLGAAESAGALKDRKIDAFFWDGGLPTGAVLDFAATPGIKIAMIPHGDAMPKWSRSMARFISSQYSQRHVQRRRRRTPVAAATNLLIANEKMDEKLAYQITKLFSNTPPIWSRCTKRQQKSV